AEDGIRDGHVTGVQTCALPIFEALGPRSIEDLAAVAETSDTLERLRETPGLGPRIDEYAHRAGQYLAYQDGHKLTTRTGVTGQRSEERRVGKAWRSGWRQDAWR